MKSGKAFKPFLFTILVFLFVAGKSLAGMEEMHKGHMHDENKPEAKSEQEEKCSVCGMKVIKSDKLYYHFEIKDGSAKFTDSLACARKFQSSNKDQIKSFMAVDNSTGEEFNPEKGFALAGSNYKSTLPSMDGKPVLVFSKEASAHEAMKTSGGEVLPFAETLKKAGK